MRFVQDKMENGLAQYLTFGKLRSWNTVNFNYDPSRKEISLYTHDAHRDKVHTKRKDSFSMHQRGRPPYLPYINMLPDENKLPISIIHVVPTPNTLKKVRRPLAYAISFNMRYRLIF